MSSLCVLLGEVLALVLSPARAQAHRRRRCWQTAQWSGTSRRSCAGRRGINRVHEPAFCAAEQPFSCLLVNRARVGQCPPQSDWDKQTSLRWHSCCRVSCWMPCALHGGTAAHEHAAGQQHHQLHQLRSVCTPSAEHLLPAAQTQHQQLNCTSSTGRGSTLNTDSPWQHRPTAKLRCTRCWPLAS